MNKILLLTTLLALAYRGTWAQDVSSVAILEYGTALLTKTDELLSSFGTAPYTISAGSSLSATSGTPVTNKPTTGGSGTGLTLDFEYSTSAMTIVTVNNPGSGYRVGDVITVDKKDIDSGADVGILTLTLQSDDFAVGQGQLDMEVDALLSSFGTAPYAISAGSSLTATTGTGGGSGTPPTNIPTTGGSGTGLTLDFEYSTSAMTSVTVNNPGSRYRVGDVITVGKKDIDSGADLGDLTLTLTKANFPGLLRRHLPDILNPAADALLTPVTSLSTTTLGGSNSATVTGKATEGGSGTGLTLDFVYSSGTITSVTVNQAGSGYRVGDAITINKNTIDTSDGEDADITITLKYDDFIGGSYRDSVGAAKSFVGSTSGGLDYYVPLQKITTGVQVVAQYTSAGSLTASMDATTDATLTTAVPSATIFSVSGGLNILKLASSVDGNYEFNLIKPDDNIKHVQGSKRSLEIAYNPGVVGEFTCAAFTNDATAPTTEANVKNNGIAKSVRTHNILQENIFNSLQMTLNGLSPSLEYDIYCYHLSHGIISNTATTVKTDLASLTAVSLAATNKIGSQNPTTITLTFTHEASLGSGDQIKLSLYKDFDTKQAIEDGDAVVTDCLSKIVITNGVGGNEVGETSCAESGANDLLIELSGSSTVSGSSGNVMVVTLTHDASVLKFENNAAAGTKVTFDLEVTGHGKLLQQPAWTTTAS